MTYVITTLCVGVKDASCVGVCPVDCIHPTEDEAHYDEAPQLYIDSYECIDCDACLIACPVAAPQPSDRLPDELMEAIAENESYYGRVAQ